MKKNILYVLIFLSCLAQAQTFNLSEEAKISVVTLGPYKHELYAAFGHSAFRVYDPINSIDEAYNYGVFDFDQPNFYLNFAKGYLYYKLGVYDYQRFQDHYIYNNRYVHEQVLALTQKEKQKFYDFLLWNAQPENENYRYDYFYNNCATKMRDVVEKVFSDAVKFDGSYINTDYTIRELTDLYLGPQPWGDLGIDIGLGLPIDKKASPYEYMFLPDYVESAFDHAFIYRNGKAFPLVENKNIIYESREEETPEGLPSPLYVFGMIAVLALALSLWDMRRKRLSTWFDVLLFTVTGTIGIVLFLLWFATDHQASKNNLNVLWAIPTHVIAVIAFIKQPKWLMKYFLVTALLCVVLLITWPILPQMLHYSLIPIVITLALRSYTQYILRKKSLGAS